MRSVRLLLIAVAMLGFCSALSAQEFFEDFESYAPGSEIHGQGGWAGWDNSSGAGAPVSDAFAYGGSNSIEIVGTSDLVHMFDVEGGTWVVTAWQYIPSGGTGTTFLIFLNTYSHGGEQDWSIQLKFDMDAGVINSEYDGDVAEPIIFDEWVEVKLVVDLNGNTVDEYYNGKLISTHEWDDNDHGTIGGIDLFGDKASSIFYDDIRIESYFASTVRAMDPSPASQATDVAREVVLKWTAGAAAATHDVYFGDSHEAVSAADRANPMGVLASQGQAGATFDPDGLLDIDATYYWRVDEVNAAPDNTIFKGDVWSFTTEPLMYTIENIVATSNLTPEAGAGPEKAVDGSGLNENGEHSVVDGDMWLGAPGADTPYIQFEFDRIYKLEEMLVWNYNGEFEMVLAFGIKDVTVEYSTDGIDWTVLGDVTLAQAPGKVSYTANTTVDFAGVGAKFVKLTINSSYGMFGKYGLSEVQFLQTPAHPRQPEPADGAVGADVLAPLTWRGGREAVSHEVSLGVDPEALESVGTVDAARFTAAELDLETTYYWQVTEVNEADAITAWVGDVWSFTTEAYRVVDDFEGYTDDIDAGGTIFQTWVDGYQKDENGATVGNLQSPFAEQTVVRAGKQSLIMTYNNAGASYSEAKANVSDLPIGQDWTKGTPTALVLWVRGALDNAASDQLYVKINGTKVVYAGGVSTPIWRQWTIDLDGINTSNVTSLTIGVDGNGAGVLYVDEIALYRIAPASAEPGSDPSLVAHWKLDETEGLTAADSSGYGNHGTLIGMEGTEWKAGTVGGALEFAGGSAANPKYITFGDSPSLQLVDSATIAAWVKMNEGNAGVYMGIAGKLTSGYYQGFALVRHESNVFRLWCDDGAGNLAGHDASSDETYTDTEWHHLVGVIDDGTSTLYVDGVKQAKQGAVDLTDSGTYAQIGKQYSDQTNHRYWKGLIDDVRIYYRALSAQEIADM